MMRPSPGMLCLVAYFGSVFSENIRHITTSGVLASETCFSSPLLAARPPLGEWQCSSSSKTADNGTAAAKPQKTKPAPEEEEPEGWTGPHACAGTYCVYSHTTFAAGRGIVVIADGETANALANTQVIVQLAGSEASQLLQSLNINTQNADIETRDIPGKGRGLVATRPIHRGEQIMAYTPVLVMHRHFIDDLDRQEQLRLLRDAVSRLPEATRVVFWRQLGRTHRPDDDDDILDIVMNNSFNLPLQQAAGGPLAGNFPEVSMHNHDCRPNVAFHLDGGVVHRTHAARRSGPGEELSISYVDSFRVRAVRRDRTARNWGFACACAQCTMPEALVNASDHRLWRIYEVESALLLDESMTASASAKEAAVHYADSVELLLSLYEQERLLDSHGAGAYEIAALNYSGLKRREAAVKYALLALEAYIVEQGSNSRGVRAMVALLDGPDDHWSWGRRLRA